MFLASKPTPNLSVVASMLTSQVHGTTETNMTNAKCEFHVESSSLSTWNFQTGNRLRPENSTQLLAYVDASSVAG